LGFGESPEKGFGWGYDLLLGLMSQGATLRGVSLGSGEPFEREDVFS